MWTLGALALVRLVEGERREPVVELGEAAHQTERSTRLAAAARVLQVVDVMSPSFQEWSK